MKQILFILLFSAASYYGKTQQAVYHWVSGFGSTGDDYGMSITTDNDGNVYTTGIFSGTVDFNPGAGLFNLTSAGNFDLFICKQNKYGDFIWAKSMGGAFDDKGLCIAIDHSGNVLTTGMFSSTSDFDPGPNTYNLTAGNYSNVFISKLDSAGNFIWAKSIECALGSDYGYSISTDAYNNVYTTGHYSGTADFDPGPGSYNATSNGMYDIFISKLDPNGNFIYAKTIGGSGIDIGYSIVSDSSGNVYSTGQFASTVDFNTGTATYNLTTTASHAIYILKLDPAGNFVWAKSFGGASGYNQGNDIALDSACNVYTTGYFDGVVDFDPGPNTFNLMYGGSFISKLDSMGNFIFARSFDNSNSSSIALDQHNNIYTTGSFSYTTDFNPGTGTYNLTPVTWGTNDVYISKLDSLGNFSWAVSVGGGNADLGNEIAVDTEGNILTTGIFGYLADFNPGPDTNYLNMFGFPDAFVLSLKECLPTNNSLFITSCKAYTFNNNNLTFNGTYYDTLVNSGGCDSIITLLLTINNVDNTVAQNGTILSSNENGATYQWVQCPTYTIIPGSTGQVFNATSNGDYAVIITKNNCVDTSNCMQVVNIGVDNLDTLAGITVCPNPSKGIISITSDMDYGVCTVNIINSVGQKIFTQKLNNLNTQIDIEDYSNGIYFLEILTTNNRYKTKFLKH